MKKLASAVIAIFLIIIQIAAAASPSVLAAPGATMPGATMPGATIPDATIPGATMPDATSPGSTIPESTIPGATMSEPVPPETSALSVYPHYLRENLARYEAFCEKNPGMPLGAALSYVNAGVDKGGYNKIAQVENPGATDILVNKNYRLPFGYVPRDLIAVGGGYKLRKEAANHFLEMLADMEELEYKLYVMAGYRTYDKQMSKHRTATASYGLAEADLQYARPGHSEHQTGLAVDIIQKKGVGSLAQAKFEASPEYGWLVENAYKYGFILRYPLGYTNIHGFMYEPWHWRYVGIGIATEMHDGGIATYEEYYGLRLAPVIAAPEKDKLPWTQAIMPE